MIERKGEVLTALSEFWFKKLAHVVQNLASGKLLILIELALLREVLVYDFVNWFSARVRHPS